MGRRCLLLLVFAVSALTSAGAQNAVGVSGSSPQTSRDYRGLSMYSGFTETHDHSVGWATELTSSVQYDFNKYFSISAGIPFYMVQPANAAQARQAGVQTAYNTRGDLFTNAVLKLDSNVLNYSMTVAATAPTGDVERGLSPGSPTVNWTNHFEHGFGPVTPFAEAGLGNSTGTASLAQMALAKRYATRTGRNRSYDTLGAMANFQAGFEFDLGHGLTFEPAAYDLLPFGDQTLISRLVPRKAALLPIVRRRRLRLYELAALSRGAAPIAADHGFSGTFTYQATRRTSISLGYTRSIHYALDTVELSFGYRFGHLPPESDAERQ